MHSRGYVGRRGPFVVYAERDTGFTAFAGFTVGARDRTPSAGGSSSRGDLSSGAVSTLIGLFSLQG